MKKQMQSRVIMDIRDICKCSYGSVVAGKAGRIFELQHDYYKIGLITPPISRGMSEELVLNAILEASEKCYTPELKREIRDRQVETACCDSSYPQRMPQGYREIHVYPDREYKNPYKRFFCLYDYLTGMPKNRWLFGFNAPVPEDGYLASRVAEEFEKALMESSEFRRRVNQWRHKK